MSQQFFRGSKHFSADWRQAQLLALLPHKDPHPQFFLEGCDAGRDGRLGRVQFFRGQGHFLEPGGSDKRFQKPEIHVWIS
jgi:hypothetical protein